MTKENLKDYAPYVVPFGLFAFLTYALPLTKMPDIYLYPAKSVIILAVLLFFFKNLKKEIKFNFDLTAIGAGIAVFFIWIGLEGFYPLLGNDDSYNPFELVSSEASLYVVIFFRFFGACLIVPVIEELFWRSFALRFLIDADIKKVPFGSFSWFSFICVSVAFGFEHFRWLPGIIAGIVYALVYYRTKNLFSPIVSHAVTNLLLGIYVFYSGAWEFW